MIHSCCCDAAYVLGVCVCSLPQLLTRAWEFRKHKKNGHNSRPGRLYHFAISLSLSLCLTLSHYSCKCICMCICICLPVCANICGIHSLIETAERAAVCLICFALPSSSSSSSSRSSLSFLCSTTHSLSSSSSSCCSSSSSLAWLLWWMCNCVLGQDRIALPQSQFQVSTLRLNSSSSSSLWYLVHPPHASAFQLLLPFLSHSTCALARMPVFFLASPFSAI